MQKSKGLSFPYPPEPFFQSAFDGVAGFLSAGLLHIDPMDVVIGLPVLLGDLHGDGAGRQGNGVGQRHQAVIALQLHGNLHDAGVDGQLGGKGAPGHIPVGLNQLPG